MKKILFTATVDSHIRQFHLPYLKMLKDMGYEVHVATNGTENFENCDVKHTVLFERSPFKINNLKAIRQLRKIINKEKFDLIHCNTPMGAAITRIAAKEARKKYGTKVIYTAHGFHFYKGAPLKNWIIYYPVEKWLAKYTDCLITINSEDYELAKRKIHVKELELINGIGVDETKFNFNISNKEKHEVRQSLKLSDDDFVIIIVGELNKNKNQIMAIEAMRFLVNKHKDIKLLLVGKGNKEKFYKEKVKKYKLKNDIMFMGYRTDVPKLIKCSNLGVSCSIREGLGLNIIEEIVSGVPCIATLNRGHIEILQNEYLVKINDTQTLVNKILNFYNKKDSIIPNAQIDKFMLKNIIKKMKKIYNNF